MTVNTYKNIMFTKKQWNDIINILFCPGITKRNVLKKIKNQDYLWYIIVSNQKYYKKHIKYNIKKIFFLCYQLEEKNQLKKIFNKIFKADYLFDQNFYKYNFNSEKGITKFIKIIYSTYGNYENFRENIKLINNIIEFNRNNYDQLLIENYNYLKNISLPLKGYELLKKNLMTIIKKLNRISPIINNSKVFFDTMTDLQKFKSIYIIKYEKEHSLYQKKLKNFYETLYSKPEYKALNHLSSKKDNRRIKIIKNNIENFFPDRCKVKDVSEILENKPACICNFSLGSYNNIPSVDKISPLLKEAIHEFYNT